MAINEEKPIPEDHPIREIWRINQLDTEGFIKLAKSGDTDAAKYLMKLHVLIRKRVLEERAMGFYISAYPSDTHVILEEYILEAIKTSYQTGNANEGFNLEKENHRPTATYKEKMDLCRIGYRVAELIEEMPSKSKAYFVASKELNISEGKARHCYEMFMKM